MLDDPGAWETTVSVTPRHGRLVALVAQRRALLFAFSLLT